ncbi:DNA helicase MCM8-like [Styela clava]
MTTPPQKQNRKKKKSGNSFFRFRGPREPQIVELTQPRVNVRPDLVRGSFCPYRAWKNYFPVEEYNLGSATASIVKVLELYMKDYFDKCDQETILNSESITIDFKEITSHNVIKTSLPEFADKLFNNPDHLLNCLGLAAHQTAVQACQKLGIEQDGEDNKPTSVDDIPVIRARISNYEPSTSLKHLKARSYGKFVSIRGTIVKVSNVKPLCTTMAFKCNMCGRMQAILLIENNYVTPNACDDPRCSGKTFSAERDHPLTEITDWQNVKLQETLSDTHRESGRMPRNVEIELSRDLADTASPGDVVTVTGIVKVKKAEENGYFSKRVRDKCMYLIYVEGNHVGNSRRKNMQDCRGLNAETPLEFSELDMKGIEEIKKQDDIFSLLVASVCPTIYGLEMVKAGIVLSLFGGAQIGSRKQDDRIPVRADSHILIVGDPGLGKSQLLRAASRLAPRGVYVCGNTSTSSGLTVTLSRDTAGDTALEAGALVLADQGVCCIDEFDKMHGQQQALLEAMEQQCISIAKAGVVCSLPARCSILAAANPVGGHYNKAKTVSENLHMGSALLSRFDLVFILLDTPDEAKDKMLSDHVMAMHTGSKAMYDEKSETTLDLTSTKPCKSSLEKRLSTYARSKDCDPLPHALAWKYIAYTRKNIHDITLSPEACQVLKNFYLELRRQGYEGDSTPITTRQLESLKRLSEAKAKVEMRNVVSAQDAMDVVEIMKHSLYDTFSDEFDSLVFTRSLNGSGVSGRGAAKKLVSALHQAARRKSGNIMSMDEMWGIAKNLNLDSTKFSDLIESLNTQGYLLNKGNRMYKLQTL